jgi:hypothetical protein
LDCARRLVLDSSKGERYYLDDPRVRSQRIVLRAWPVSERKVIVEAYAEQDCPIELAVLPALSAFDSVEAEELTKLLLSERGARLFSQGRRVFNETMVLNTLRGAMELEAERTWTRQMLKSLDGAAKTISETVEQQRQERLERWRKTIGGEA